MIKMKNDEKITVYMEFINKWNEVTDTAEIAVFRSIGWAEHFLRWLYRDMQLSSDVELNSRYWIKTASEDIFITKDCDAEGIENTISLLKSQKISVKKN